MKITMKYKINFAKIQHIRFIWMAVFALGVAIGTSAQVTVREKNVPIRQILKTIEKNTEYKFFYNDNFTALDKVASLSVNNVSIDNALSALFSSSGISWEKKDKNQIVLVPEKTSDKTQLSDGQTRKISGIVTDVSTGESLLGVSIFVEGTKIGVISDFNGKFTIDAPGSSSTLVFSYIGYVSKKTTVGKQNIIKIALESDQKALDEVVVVGYGTQKKVNLTGSVSSISATALESRPITQTSQALAGLVSGVTVSQGSGRPGDDGSSIKIRGLGTFSGAGTEPLVLIDGLAGNINDVDPSAIKSISVLKDAASSAIYGTRAANGVILVETKRGEKGKMQISYNNYMGWQKVTALPQFVDSWEYATLKGGYTADQIAKYKDGSDPDNYPNVSHLKDLLSTGSGFQTSHNLNFMGGDDKNSYIFSLGYLSQNGVVAKDKYQQYNFGLNFDSKISEKLKLKVDLKGYSRNRDEPRSTGDMNAMIGFAVREPNTYAGKKSDGTWGYQDDYAPEAWMSSESFSNYKSKNFLGGMELAWELMKGLTVSGKAGYKYYNWTDQWYQSTFKFNDSKTYGPNKLEVSSGDNSLLTLQALVQYTKTIEKHNISVLGGYSQEAYREDRITASRDNFPNNALYELNAGSASNMQNSGWGTEWALRSYFGRINYDFGGKYLFEANARYDGTSRFPKNNRWGLFPSLSAGWRISEESFMKENVSWIDNLKLRASWGQLGNQNISNYPYQYVLGTGWNYTFGGSLASGIKLATLPNIDVRWETTTITDIGIDLSILKDKLSMTLDYFDKTTNDILYPKSVSSVLGLSTAEYNAGEVNNKGIEVVMNYHTSIGKMKIGISPNFSYIHNKVTKLGDNLTKDIDKGLFVGESINAIYGYEADGLFIDAADVSSYASQPYSAKPGTIRYKDISGPDGIPDGKVDATYDRKVIGSTFPKYSYGATITADYKGFDFSILLQGLAGYKKQMGSYMAFAFYNGGNVQRWQADGAWTTANPDRNAIYPQIKDGGVNMSEFPPSTFWNKSASFLRLKNLQLGYTIPKSLTHRLGINSLRIFYSGQNLFTVNHFYEGWDPEMYQSNNDQPSFYPITAVHTFGLNIKL